MSGWFGVGECVSLGPPIQGREPPLEEAFPSSLFSGVGETPEEITRQAGTATGRVVRQVVSGAAEGLYAGVTGQPPPEFWASLRTVAIIGAAVLVGVVMLTRKAR